MEAVMQVELLGVTRLAQEYEFKNGSTIDNLGVHQSIDDTELIAFNAIRTCYSENPTSDILLKEGAKYFNRPNTEGEGTEKDRLFNLVVNSGHTSTLEHINFTYAVMGVSRSLLAQLTRHRHMSFSVQGQRYVKWGSGDKSGGFDFVVPPKIHYSDEAYDIYTTAMERIQEIYDMLRKHKIPAEDARFILPNGVVCNIVLTCNLRALLEFYKKRKPGNGAQWEIANLATSLKQAAIDEVSWIAPYFEEA